MFQIVPGKHKWDINGTTYAKWTQSNKSGTQIGHKWDIHLTLLNVNGT